MATESFMIQNYQVALGHGLSATWNGTAITSRGSIVCHGAEHQLVAYFLAEDSPVPKPVYDVDEQVGAIFLPFDAMDAFVDLLRNEKPIYAHLDSDSPESNQIRTTREPVGEGEVT